MRIGRGAGPSGMNLQVIPFRERLDWNEAAMRPDDLVYHDPDIFTTHDGSWEVVSAASMKASQESTLERNELTELALAPGLFGIDQWARDAYLFPPNDPRYCAEGGADHDILVCIQGTNGERLNGAGVVFSSDGPAWLQPPTDLSHVVKLNTKSSGWCNLTMYPGSVSYPPALGPWTCGKLASASDLVMGMGTPWAWHVSTFIVFQATRWGDLQPVYQTLREALLAGAAAHWAIQLNPNAALQRRIFATGSLGFVPTSAEFDVTHGGGDYVAQACEHLGTGEVRIYYCPKTNYSQVAFEVR